MIPLANTRWPALAALVLALNALQAQAAGAMPATAPSSSAVAPSPDHVTPSYDMAQLVTLALTHNTGLRAAQSAVVGAQAGVTSAQALPNPRLEWSRGPWQNQTLPSADAGRGQALTVAQPLENPWVRSARVQAARAGAEGSRAQLASVRNDLVALVRQRAFEALLHQAQAQAAAESLALLEQVQQRVRVRVDSGEAARYELIKADAEVINARERQQTASLQAEQALLEINRLVAGQLPARWQLRGQLDAPPVTLPELGLLQEQARQRNPELVALRHDVDRAQAKLSQARASVLPAVDLRYTEQKDPQTRLSQWGVGVQIPLLDQRQGPIAEAQAELDRQRTRLEGHQNELQQRVLLAWRAVEIARLRVEALGQGVLREAEAALRVAQAAYRFGERGILDVLDAQRVLRSVRADLLQARFELHSAHIALDQLSGRYAQETP